MFIFCLFGDVDWLSNGGGRSRSLYGYIVVRVRSCCIRVPYVVMDINMYIYTILIGIGGNSRVVVMAIVVPGRTGSATGK